MSQICLWGDVHPEQLPPADRVKKLTGGRPLFCNLEAPLTRQQAVGAKAVHLLAAPERVADLKAAGVIAVHVANNHALDGGAAGLAETLTHLREVGIAAVGVGADQGGSRPVTLSISGARVTFLGYGETSVPPLAPQQEALMLRDVETLREQCDRLIVSLHWGLDYVAEPSPQQRRLARSLINAGADLLVGHHSHLAAGVERIGSGWACYSLGNAALWVQNADSTPAPSSGVQLIYDLESSALTLQRLRPGERPGELAVGEQHDDHDDLVTGTDRWLPYLRAAGPIYLRTHRSGWRQRFADHGVGQVRPLLRWFLSRTFLQMTYGYLLSSARERGRRG